VSSAGFLAIYLGFGGLTWLATTRLFPRLGWGRPLPSPPAIAPGQLGREIRLSLVSIALFGGWSVASVAAERAGWVSIAWQTNWARVPLELAGLVLWNDLHFFAIHRLLHTRWLFKHVHREHHRALRPTPLSSYAMHPVEAALLGSVMFVVMPVVTLSLGTLLLFPMVSLALNNLGHMSYDLVPARSDWHPLASSRRHALHHSRVAVNYGFLLPVLDRLLGTDRPRSTVT
jgi:sterol desaturase/sphingolipid hydroxylase (fatty acid hydroxylase superfamily)